MRSLPLAAGCAQTAKAATPAISLDALRNVTTAHGINLSDERLRVVKPVLEQRLPRLRTLRDVDVDDSVAPTQGILDK